ncbi:MAG: hypothetical protein QOK42_790, partial [Frankiaceae bacterium]|nr:hypothetical protein [Frankiaceae bacterium]
PPKAVTAAAKNRSDGVQLTWTTPDTAQRPLQYYEVLRGETADTLQSLQQIVPATHTFADRLGSASAPLADHDYVYGVRAHTDHGDGPVVTVTGHTPAVAAPVTADAIATIDPAYGAPTFTPRLHRYDGAAGAAVAVTSVASGGLTVTASTAGDTTPLNLQIAGSPYGTELTVASYSHPYYLANEPGMSGCSAQQTDFTISEIAYDSGGAIARMAADYLYRCATDGPPVVGSIRWHSDAPYTAATVTTPAADFPVKVGQAQNLLITYRNLGTTDIHVSGASLAPVSPSGSTSEWSILSDPCAGATLAPQAQCTSTVRVTAASASHREVLVQFGDDTVLGSHTRKVSVYGVAAPPAPTGLAAVTAGSKGTTITWHQSFPAHATPSQWLLYRKVNSGSYALLKTVSVGTTPTSGKYVDPDLRSGLRSYYVRAVNIAGTGASSAALAVRYGPQPTRSTYAVGLTRRVVVTWLQPISSITAHALTGYAISRVSSSGALVRLGTRTLTQNFSFPATGLTPGQRITLKVQALYGTQVGPAVSVSGTATSSSLLVVRSDGRLYGRGVTGGSSVSVDQPHTFSYEWLLGHSSPPAFSPDRHYMVCSVYNGAAGYPYQLVVRRTDGAGSPRIMTTGANDDVSPAVSHDGKWVVFTRFTRSTGQYHLYKVPWSGGTPTLIPNSRDLDEPAWSADGKSLFATNIATEAWGLYRLTLGGTRTKVGGTGRNHSPVISPDGKSLAFLTTSATTHQSVLKLMTVTTRAVRSLVTAGGTVFSESWTPDSAQIYFVALSVTSDATTLRRINRTGTGSTLLTSLGTKARFVVFEKW